MRFERGGDLARLDAVAANLHLRIGAAHVPHEPSDPRRTTSPVRYIRSPADERIGDESLTGLGGATQIAAGQLGAAEVQFARRPVGTGRSAESST